MSKVLVTDTHLSDIAAAIRQKNGESTIYKPSEMAAAILDIDTGYPEPTGTISITENGTHNVKDYASAAVNVPNSYSAGDEGKVVSNGALVAQGSDTVTDNGVVDTTLISSLTVNVSGGGATLDPDHMYYNGYLLPTLPIISGYPYVWIRRNKQTGYFDALFGPSVWYSDNSDSNLSADNWALKTSSMPDYKWYRCPITGTSTGVWTEYSGTTYDTMGTNNNRDVIWTNEDIRFNSPTATEKILIKGYPVPHYIT